MELRTINEVIPTMKTGSGIFSAFVDPMWSDLFTASSLDIFFAGTYGNKFISPYTDLFVGEDGKISSEDLTSFAAAIYEIRATEWSKLLADLTSEYDPLANTDATESETVSKTISGSNGNTRTLNTTQSTGNTRTLNTRTDKVDGGTTHSASSGSGSDVNIGSGSDSRDNTIFGFDSSTAVGDNSTSGSSSSRNENRTSTSSTADITASTSGYNTDTGTIADQGAITDSGTITDAGTNSGTESTTRSYHKYGNIGIMTNVQLLRDDTDYWRYWSFIKTICEDICDIIALSVY